MKSEQIIVRNYNGRALIRWAIGREGNTVYITDNEGVEEIKAANNTRRLVGIRCQDVFEYNPKYQFIEGKAIEWQKMKKYDSR